MASLFLQFLKPGALGAKITGYLSVVHTNFPSLIVQVLCLEGPQCFSEQDYKKLVGGQIKDRVTLLTSLPDHLAKEYKMQY